jgi:cell division protein FtsW
MIPSRLHSEDEQSLGRAARYDIPLLASVGILLLVSLILVMSSSSAIAYARDGHTLSIFFQHFVRVLAGIGFMAALTFFDYHRLGKLVSPLFLVTLILLVLVLFWPLKTGATSHRQLYWGSMAMQPAELAKFALVLFLAYHFSLPRSEPARRSFDTAFTRAIAVTALVVGLILLETNVSMAVLILVSAIAMFFLSGVSAKILSLTAVVSALAIIITILLVPYTQARLSDFASGLLHPSQACFHTRQSIIGLGKGGLWGSGLGQSTWAHFRLPIPYKDSIFCILGEELGFIGCVGLTLLFSILLSRGVRIAKNAPDLFGYYLAYGLLIVIACTFMINVGVAVGLLPPTGQPLPFVSYGGSSLVVSLASVGILLNIHRQGAVLAECRARPHDDECT